VRELIASKATQRAPPREHRVFKGPVLLGRTRRDIAELIGWVWLAIEVARLVRGRLDERSRVLRAEQAT
jgi:hypothetical protein